jgi:hypothetical protein
MCDQRENAAVVPALSRQCPRCSLCPASLAVHFYPFRPRIIRLDAGDFGLQLIRWIPAILGAVAVVPWNAKQQKNRSCLPLCPGYLVRPFLKEAVCTYVFLLFYLKGISRAPCKVMN